MLEEGYDALLVVSFGGPEGMEDVEPFLDNVLKGRAVSIARRQEVAHHYERFGGVSPINQQCRDLIHAIQSELQNHSIALPIFWGNRNWKPFLSDTIGNLASSGHRRILAFFTSAFSCYSGCRQYRENLDEAKQIAKAEHLVIDKLRMPYNHPGFIAANRLHLGESLKNIHEADRNQTNVFFCAHSIPLAMAERSRYREQLLEASRLVMDGLPNPWKLVYQSRSGNPHQPWLEPDVCDAIGEQAARGKFEPILLHPIGFLSDHMEVLYDLDVEAKEKGTSLKIPIFRSSTVGCHPQWIAAIRELIEERLLGKPKKWLGDHGPSHDRCPSECCLIR